MAAVTNVISRGRLIPWGGPTPGGLWAEPWAMQTASAGDTQTLSSNLLTEILYVVGAPHTAPSGNTVPITIPNAIGASSFQEIFVIGRSTAP